MQEYVTSCLNPTGSHSVFCKTPRTTFPNVAPGVLQDPTSNIHEAYYLIFDQHTGDIFWTEDLSRRVLVRRSDGRIMRIAGNGNAGVDAGGSVAPGAIALNTALAVPSSITLDPWRALVFLDGYSPGRVLRLEQNGTLHVLAAIALSPSLSAPHIDGPIERATAHKLSGLAFVDGGAALLVADTSTVSFVRRIDLVAGTVTRVLGASVGNPGDGAPLLESVFAQITAVTTGPGGSILVSDRGVNSLRVGISENQKIVSVFFYLTMCSKCFLRSVFCRHPRTAELVPCGLPVPLRDTHRLHGSCSLLSSRRN